MTEEDGKTRFLIEEEKMCKQKKNTYDVLKRERGIIREVAVGLGKREMVKNFLSHLVIYVTICSKHFNSKDIISFNFKYFSELQCFYSMINKSREGSETLETSCKREEEDKEWNIVTIILQQRRIQK